MFLSYDEIAARLDAEEAQGVSGNVHVRVVLEPGDSSWDPSSTKRDIYGPATVVYTRYADGAHEAQVR